MTAAIKVRMPPAEVRELQRWARMQDMNVSEFVRRMFEVHRRVAADRMADQIVERLGASDETQPSSASRVAA
jgi:hypothetical protein